MVKKIPVIKFCRNFAILIINLHMDPDPDWIRIQQHTGSESGFRKIPGPDSVNTDSRGIRKFLMANVVIIKLLLSRV